MKSNRDGIAAKVYIHPGRRRPRDPVLEELFSRHGLISELAEHLNIRRQAVSAWRKVPEGRIKEVARFTGISQRRLREGI
jgi:hypothetical protein